MPHEFRALPRVSRQIRKEVISYVAQHNNFSIRWQQLETKEKDIYRFFDKVLHLDLFPHDGHDNCPLSICCVDKSFRFYCRYRVEHVFLRCWDFYGNVSEADCEAVAEELKDILTDGRPVARKPYVEYEIIRLYRSL